MGEETLLAQSSLPQKPDNSANRASGPTQTVKVSDLPPLSITKDWTDRAYWVFTFFLVAIGGLQMFLLWGNLRAIQRQANQMEHQSTILEKTVALAEKTAETARQNSDMLVNRERGRLRVELLPLAWPLAPGPAQLKYKVSLYGASEAYIAGSCARAEIVDSPDASDDVPLSPAMSIPQVITPTDRTVEAQVQGIFPRMTLEPADLDALDAGKKFIQFRGFIRYEDVFGSERWTRFRRVWKLAALPNPDGTRSGRWSRCGSAKDNSES